MSVSIGDSFLTFKFEARQTPHANVAKASASQTQVNAVADETPEQTARRKKAAKNKAKRERQKAKAKAALQQVRAAQAAGVSVGQDPPTVSHAEMQAQMQAQIQAQMQAQMARRAHRFCFQES